MVTCSLQVGKKRCFLNLCLLNLTLDSISYQEVRAAQCYQKSVAAVTGHRGWEKVPDSCKEVLACSIDWLSLLRRVKGAEELQLLNSARLSVANVVKAVEKAQAKVETGKLSEEMEGLVAPVREALNLLMDRVTELKS